MFIPEVTSMSRSAIHHTRAGTRPSRRLAGIAIAALLLAATLSSPVNADPAHSYVREWNLHATNAIYNATDAAVPPGVPPGAAQPPYVGGLHLAMVQGAVYDAVNAIEGSHEPYLLAHGTAQATASLDAATVTAAYEVLAAPTLRMRPSTLTWLGSEHSASMAEIEAVTTDAEFDAGVAAGHAAATAMLEARDADGRFPADPFFHPEGTGTGEWRPVTAGARDMFAWVGNVEPFMLNSQSQLRTDGPPSVTSRRYAREYNEVKNLGAATGSTRTQAQTDLANFYQPNPVEILNRTFRTIADDHGLSVAEEARLFGMLNLAAADAFISCWNDKTLHHFWRPITAIQNGDVDGNSRTTGSTTWAPFIGNPPYPEHPSGYNCASSALMYAAREFFGTDRVGFSVQRTPAAGAPVRGYTRFTDVVDDTIDARVYQGIHFRTADVQAAKIGKKAAQWMERHFFEPIDDDDDDD
jgi:hypothetical protein